VAYAPPSRTTFRATVQRALRDPNGVVFPAATVNDFINEGLMDLSAYRPQDVLRSAPWLPGTWDINQTLDMSDVSDVWQVFVRENDLDPREPTLFIPSADYGEGRAGWDFLPPSNLRIARIWVYRLQEWAKRASTLTIHAHGYAYRVLPTSDATLLDLENVIDQYCLLQHCKMLGFQMLNADRALYQQWLAATNNTDVSPTQLQGMLSISEQAYDRARQRNTILRRRPTNFDVIAF